jgi:hypothetical protein
MTFTRIAVITVLTACATSIAVAQERTAMVTAPSDEAASQKRCDEKAKHDKLSDNLRPSFMMECVANAKLDTPQTPAEQK